MHPSFEAYLAHLEVIQKSPLTIRRYGDVFRDLDSFADDSDPAKLTTDVLLRFASAPRHDGCPRAPAGVNLRVAVLKAAFSFLIDRGLVQTNPASRLVGVREPRHIPKYLTTAEVTRLVLHVANRRSANRARNLAIVVVLWQTALRVSELARLTWAQLDLERKTLRDVLVKGGHVLDVPVNEETIATLMAYRTLRGEVRGEDPIFARGDGRALSVRAIESLFETWRAELGWTRALYPHILRHTLATTVLALGTDISTVAALLRHNGLRSVMVYAVVQDHARRAALAKLGALVPRGILEGIAANDAGAEPPEETTCVEEPFYEHGDAA
jgi:integrase/recombinase XerC